MSDAAETPRGAHRFISHRRTVTETNIVNVVNVVGLHKPFFIDMEYIKPNCLRSIAAASRRNRWSSRSAWDWSPPSCSASSRRSSPARPPVHSPG